jgi:hypothetical protein
MQKKHNYEFKKIRNQMIIYAALFILQLILNLGYYYDQYKYLDRIKRGGIDICSRDDITDFF